MLRDELAIGLLHVAVNQPAGLMEQLRRDETGLLSAVRLVLPADGALLRTFKGHTTTVWTLDWTSEGDRLLATSLDQTVKVWEVDAGAELFC